MLGRAKHSRDARVTNPRVGCVKQNKGWPDTVANQAENHGQLLSGLCPKFPFPIIFSGTEEACVVTCHKSFACARLH
jgi:hypothetical protein